MLLLFICKFPWWLWFLLPFLLGLLLGWLIWGRFQKMVGDLQAEVRRLKSRVSELEAELEKCRAKKAELNSALTLCEGRLKESNKAPAAKAAPTPPPAPAPSKPLGIASTPTPAPAPAAKTNMYAALKPDNLQVVEGIGPKMNEVLKKHGVHTWAELGSSNFDALRGILDKENPKRYRIIDPTTWPAQAKLANDGEWDKLIAMQKQLDTGRSGVSDHETDSKVEKMLIKLGVLKRWKQDDLKAVEGIGPKIEGLLKADGIDTWRKLSNAQVSTIQDILTKAGKRYKLADPTTWPKQAGMCADGKWDELETYQDQLNGGK
jgi:predicted flap endonuclease-1-like 5' DNA nuclease